MSSRKSASKIITDPKKVLEIFRSARDELVQRGDADRVEKLINGMAEELDVSPDAVTAQLANARAAVDERRLRIGPEARDAATAAGCSIDVKLPFITIGCVTVQESSKQPGAWTLSILDSVSVETVTTTSGQVLVEHAIARIVEIESALKRKDAFAKDLKSAFDAVDLTSGSAVSANVLMVLCSQGRALRNVLASADKIQTDRGLSRAQFGFLLAAVSQPGSSADGKGVKLRFHGATQFETKNAYKYVSIPESTDPRKECKSRKVTSISIDKG